MEIKSEPVLMEKLKILIIDNELNDIFILTSSKIFSNYEVTGVTANYYEVSKKIGQLKPDLILMDLSPWAKDDLSALDSCLEIFQKGNIPVIFLSNKLEKVLLKKTSLINNSTFLTKPLRESDLTNSINELLQLKKHPANKNVDERNEWIRVKVLEKYEITATPAEESFDRITQITTQFFNVPATAICFVDQEIIWFKSVQGIKVKEIRRNNYNFKAFLPKGFYFEEKKDQTRNFIGDQIMPDAKFKYFASAPLITPDGHTIGALCIFDFQPRSINKSAEKIFYDFTAIIMDEMELRLASRRAVKLQKELISITTGESDHSIHDPESVDFISEPLITDEKKSVRKMSALIKDAEKQIDQIIDELFESSITSGGKINLNRENIDLAEIATEVVDSYIETALCLLQKLRLMIESHPMIYGDRQRIKEVMINLVDNAIKYSPLESIIEVNVIGAEGKAYFEVKDQGQGLTEEDKVLLFTKFARLSAKPTAGEPSTGIGLPIVKFIVELHGGIVRAESEGKDMGSSFIVEFPKIN